MEQQSGRGKIIEDVPAYSSASSRHVTQLSAAIPTYNRYFSTLIAVMTCGKHVDSSIPAIDPHQRAHVHDWHARAHTAHRTATCYIHDAS